MLAQLRATNTDLNVEILGVNQIGDSDSNPLITAGRVLPWLQDTAEDAVWASWQVTYRDVRILDSENRLFAVYNLTDHDLSVPANFETLKQLFLQAAVIVDSDKDGLPDSWEAAHFGTLPAAPDDDADGDGASNFAEYAFGTNPKDPTSVLATKPMPRSASSTPIAYTFHRRAGGAVLYSIESSSDLKQWAPATAEALTVGSPQNLFDGTGTSQVTLTPTAIGLGEPGRFYRIKAARRP